MTPVQGPDREESLNQMVLTYEKDLQRLCCAYLKDIDLARDAVQETFLKAYRQMDQFNGKASEKTWLMRIAINTCKDVLRGGWFRHMDRTAVLEDLPLPVDPPQRGAYRLDQCHHGAAPQVHGGHPPALRSGHEYS